MTTSITSFDDKSYPKKELLTKGCVDSFIMTQMKHLPGESFQFGSTYPFRRFSLLRFATDLGFFTSRGIKGYYKFNDDIKKLVKSVRPALKSLRSVQYDHINKIDNDIWDRLVAKPREKYFASGDSLNFMIKWCELLNNQIAYISSYDLQLVIDHQDKLTNGEFEKSNPEQYSSFVEKFDSKTIIFPYNKNKDHWVIYLLMNHHNSTLIKTNSGNTDEVNISKNIQNEEMPCIICFDSLSSQTEKKISTVKTANNTSVVGDEVSEFIYSFLNYLQRTNIYDHFTLPLFFAKCAEQNGNSCGYHAMMNMLILTRFAGEYTPLKFKDCNVRIASLRTYVNGIMRRERYDFPDNIFYDRKGDKMDQFKFALRNSSNLDDFYPELETLISRMSFFDHTISSTKEGKSLQNVFKNVFVTKRWTSGSLKKTKSGEMKAEISTQFIEFMKNDPPAILQSCQCFGKIPDYLRLLASKKLQCDLFKESVDYLPRDFDEVFYGIENGRSKPLYYYALVNNCQLRPTNIIPDGGNCGLCAFSLVLRSNYDLISKLNDLRESINLQPLFEYPTFRGYEKKQHSKLKKEILFHFDWMSYLRLHWAEMLDTNSSVIEELLAPNVSLIKMRNMYTFDKNDAAHPNIEGDSSVNSRARKRELKELFEESNQDDFFAEYSESYCKVVARYCLELCLFQEKLNIEIVLKAIQKFISMNPKDVGKFGCYWINSSAIDWFDQTFFVKTIILTCSDSSWIGSPFSINGTIRGEENLFYDIDDCRKNNRFIPYGFYIVVHDGNHFESLIMCKPFDSTFYWVGNDLPEILYEHLSIDKEKWRSLDLDTVHNFNVEMMKNNEGNNNLKKLPLTTLGKKQDIHKSFESSVPNQNFCFAPLRLAWNCVKGSIPKNDTDFNMELYKDLTENENWGILQPKLASEVFAISLCLDLKQTFYEHHVNWNDLKNIIKKDEKKIKQSENERKKTPQNNPPANKDIEDVHELEKTIDNPKEKDTSLNKDNKENQQTKKTKKTSTNPEDERKSASQTTNQTPNNDEMESEDPNETPQDPKDTNESAGKKTPTRNENESSKKDEAKNPSNDSQTKIQTPEKPRSEIQSRLSSEGKSVGDMSWNTHFSFSSNNKNFQEICQNVIKDITKKDLGNNIPSYEQRIKDKSQLEKEEICKDYVTLLEQKQNEEKDRILQKAQGTKRGKQIQVNDEFVRLDLLLKDAINKLNGIFKLPRKIKVSGLSGFLTQDNDQGEPEPSHVSYDDTNVNSLRNEITKTVRERYIRSGYFYIPTKEKVVGTIRSCVHDAISIALSRFNVLGIKEKLYEKFPPFVDKDTFLNPLIESEIVTRYVRFVELNLLELGIGGPLLWLLHEKNLKSGVYLVFCKTSHYCKKTKKNIYQHHTIVYDSNYEVTWSGKILKGALIDNRKDKHLIALENKDRSSKDQCRRTLDKWFSGYNTKIRFLMRVIPRHPLQYFGEPDPTNQTNVLEFEKKMNLEKQFASLPNNGIVNKESNKTRKRNLNKRRKEKLKRIKKAQEKYHFDMETSYKKTEHK